MARTHRQARDHVEKRARVEALLADPAWLAKSTAWLAAEAGVSWLFADKVRAQYEFAQDSSVPTRREARDGHHYQSYSSRREPS